MSDLTKHVESLVKQADDAKQADSALKFSQAASNVANAMLALSSYKAHESQQAQTP